MMHRCRVDKDGRSLQQLMIWTKLSCNFWCFSSPASKFWTFILKSVHFPCWLLPPSELVWVTGLVRHTDRQTPDWCFIHTSMDESSAIIKQATYLPWVCSGAQLWLPQEFCRRTFLWVLTPFKLSVKIIVNYSTMLKSVNVGCSRHYHIQWMSVYYSCWWWSAKSSRCW